MNVTEVTSQTQTPRPSAARQLELAFESYQGELLGTLYCLLGNREDARDALQDTFVKCWRHREKLPEIRQLRAWIFRIAVNTGRDQRQTAWRRRKQSLPDESPLVSSRQPGPAIRVEHEERLDLLRQAVQRLRPEEREVFLLRQNGQLTYEEIGAAVGIPLGTVKTRMRLALKRLREALQGH